MGECQFCGDPATLDLDTKPVCYDCLQRIGTDPEARFSAVLNSLITVHARLCQVGQHGYASTWAKDLARRIEVCRQNGLFADVAQMANEVSMPTIATIDSVTLTTDAILSGAARAAGVEASKRKRSGALKIRK